MKITINRTKYNMTQTIEYYLLCLVYLSLFIINYKYVIVPCFGYEGYIDESTFGWKIVSVVLFWGFAKLNKKCYFNDNRISNEIVHILFALSITPFCAMTFFGQFPASFVFCNSLFWLFMYLFHTGFLGLGREGVGIGMKHPIAFQEIKIIAAISCLTIIYISGRYTHFRFNFNLDLVYEYRAEISSYGIPTVLVYIFSWTKNLNVILTAYFIRKKNVAWSLLMIVCQLLSFGYDGMKGTLFLIILVVIINLIPTYSTYKFNRLTFWGLSIVCIMAFLQYLITKNSMIASLFIRRVSLVTVHLEQCYFDFFSSHTPDYFRSSFLRHLGFSSPYQNLGRIIGGVYFGKPNMNCNNGLLSDAMTNFGYIGILMTPLLIQGTLWVLDCSCEGIDTRIYISCALNLAMLMMNTFYFTMLLTHGLIIIPVLLSALSRDEITRTESITKFSVG